MCSKINVSREPQKYPFTLVWQSPLPPPEFSFSPASTHDNGWVSETQSVPSCLYPHVPIMGGVSLAWPGHLHCPLPAPASHHGNGRGRCERRDGEGRPEECPVPTAPAASPKATLNKHIIWGETIYFARVTSESFTLLLRP